MTEDKVSAHLLPDIPNQVARLARSQFSPDNFYIRVGDQLENIINIIGLTSSDFSFIPTSFPVSLPLAIIFQHIEEINDQNTALSILNSIEWKYALHLPLHPPSVSPNIFCTIRRSILDDEALTKTFEKLIQSINEILPKSHFLGENNVEQLIWDICDINRISVLRTLLSKALTTLEKECPEFIKSNINTYIYLKYLPSMSHFDVLVPYENVSHDAETIFLDIMNFLDEIKLNNCRKLSGLEDIKNLFDIQNQMISSEIFNSSDTAGLHCGECIVFFNTELGGP
jgi:hypothetical protein